MKERTSLRVRGCKFPPFFDELQLRYFNSVPLNNNVYLEKTSNFLTGPTFFKNFQLFEGMNLNCHPNVIPVPFCSSSSI